MAKTVKPEPTDVVDAPVVVETVKLKEVGNDEYPGLGRVQDFPKEHAEVLLAAQAKGTYPVLWEKAEESETVTETAELGQLA